MYSPSLHAVGRKTTNTHLVWSSYIEFTKTTCSSMPRKNILQDVGSRNIQGEHVLCQLNPGPKSKPELNSSVLILFPQLSDDKVRAGDRFYALPRMESLRLKFPRPIYFQNKRSGWKHIGSITIECICGVSDEMWLFISTEVIQDIVSSWRQSGPEDCKVGLLDDINNRNQTCAIVH